MNKTAITFKPKQISKRLLSALSARARDIITSRYGLGKSVERQTLEAIGGKYNITRERIRQIENHALSTIRSSGAYAKEKTAFEELESIIKKLGGVVVEQHLLEYISKDKSVQNHTHFILVVGESFKKNKEDDDFRHRWYINEELARRIEESIRKFYGTLSDDALVPESEIVSSFLNHLKEVSEEYKDQEVVKRWLALSRHIGKNPLGEWGKTSSPNIRAKSIRDYAFLVIRKHGSPIHFTQVARSIEKLFGKKAHIATCHNELIKDPRFVLVGRGLYALAEWGYMSGVVRDVIRKIMEKSGPLTKKEVIEKVLKDRYVKENTIVVNLQNQKYFKKDKDSKYSIVS